MQKLNLIPDLYNNLGHGKLSTIRKGKRNISTGKLIFENSENGDQKTVSVVEVYYCNLKDVRFKDVQNDGFQNHEELFDKMKIFYPNIRPIDLVTVVRFEV